MQPEVLTTSHYTLNLVRPLMGSTPILAVVPVAADLAKATNPAIGNPVGFFCPGGKQENTKVRAVPAVEISPPLPLAPLLSWRTGCWRCCC